jgi:hypothetical protein
MTGLFTRWKRNEPLITSHTHSSRTHSKPQIGKKRSLFDDIIGFIRLSGYSSLRISSRVGALSLDEFFTLGNPFDILFQFSVKSFISQNSLAAL